MSNTQSDLFFIETRIKGIENELSMIREALKRIEERHNAK